MRVFKKRAISATVASMFVASGAAFMAAPTFAQQADAAKDDVIGVEKIVVTATSQQKSKMRSSVSVTDVSGEQIKDFGARTEAEVLLLIPGVRTDTAAGAGGNANISVRGLPISSGGSKYVQLQEDGLPTVQFGDMNFANNDYWTRIDNNVDSIQTLRGGSSSLFASHAPGAVINYISKTGKEQGGSVGFTHGLSYKLDRLDFDTGGKTTAADEYYHLGGYYREGEGGNRTTDNALNGYQFKGNWTKEFNGGKGYFRVNFKALNEHAPANAQSYLTASTSGNNIGSFARAPGFDGTRDAGTSIYNQSITTVDPATRGITTSSLLDGITVNSRSMGFEFHNVADNGFSVDNKFRLSANAGSFQTQFWNTQTLANLLGGFGAGATAKYYNGSNKGTAVTAANLTNGLVSQSAAINTQTPDMGNIVNDLSVSKVFNFDGGFKLDTKAGFFHSRQNVVQTWSIAERVVEAAQNGAVIDVYDATGKALTSAGLTGYNNQWGCCARDINARFTTDAPYLSLNAGVGDFDVEGGIRHETFKANGRYAGPKKLAGGVDVNGDGVINGAENNVFVADVTNPSLVNYKISYNNFSGGANYRITKDLSVFARYSEGNRAIADRLLFSSNINPVTGQLAAGGATAALAPVKQTELGTKFRGNMGGVNYGVAATLFRSTTNEFDYDQTREDDPTKPGFKGPKLNQLGYKANGLELESGMSVGGFGLNANVVYSKEEITLDVGGSAVDAANPTKAKTTQVGKTSDGVPKWRYTISPRYAFGPAVVGAIIRGQGEVLTAGNSKTIDGHAIVNAFANYDFGRGISGSLNVSNLLDKVYPVGDGNFVGGSTSIFSGGVERGRTASATVKYTF